MGVVIGTNSGFVTEAPVEDPLSSSRSQIDNNKIATYDTSPELAELITEIGWWCSTATEEADFQVALYSNNSGAPYTRLYYSTASAKGTSDGWKVIDGLNWEITASTGYWIVVSCADTSSTTYVDWYSSGGSGIYSTYGSPSLTNPWQYGSGDADAKAAIYAVCEVGEPPVAEGPITYINIGDVFHEISELYINIGDSWRQVSEMFINIGDTWHQGFTT